MTVIDYGPAMTISETLDRLETGTVDANGITITYRALGEGPLVVLCHGWPESWYSWRHQLGPVADAGFRVVAPSMRGYGDTTAPLDIDAYSINHLIGDVVGLVRGLGAEDAIVVGHDWGAPVAWYSALTRPDVFRAVVGMSVPFAPPTGALPDGVTVNDVMRATAGPDRDYYRLYFQEPGVAETEFEADPRHTMRAVLCSISGEASDGLPGWDGFFPAGQRLADQFTAPESLPAWLTEDDLDVYTEEITRSGFRGGLNWYRNINRIPGCLAPWAGDAPKQPSLYVGGSADMIAGNTPEAIAGMEAVLGDLRGLHLWEGAGHWIQQERPAETNAALLEFLSGL